jgi:putative tricarboxylic transport membrane protein
MVTSKRVAGGVLALIGALALWEGLRFPFGTMSRPGPAYAPAVLSLLLIVLGAVLILTRDGGPRLAAMDWGDWRRALAILAVSAFIAFTLELLGWRLAVSVALLALLGLLERRGAVFTVVLTAAIVFGSFFLFNDVLKVPLPRGPLGL